MIIALINSDRYFTGKTITDIMRNTVIAGYYENNDDFIKCMNTIEFYNTTDTPMEVSVTVSEPVFTIK